MFSRLLNTLLRWFGQPRQVASDKAPASSAPAHWLQARETGPPEHWLRATQAANTMMRVAAGDSTEPVPAFPARPAPATPQSTSVLHKQWLAKEKPVEESRTAVRSESPTDEVTAARVPSVTFAKRPGSPMESVKWNGTQGEKPKANFVVQFVAWLTKKTFSRKPTALGEELAAKSETKPAEVIRFDSRVSRIKTQDPAPQTPSDGKRLAPLVFPASARKKSTEKSRKQSAVAVEVKGPPVQWTERQENQGLILQACADAQTAPVLPERSARPARQEIYVDPQPTCWPDFSPRSERAPVPFTEETAVQPTERTQASPGEPNWWPELGAERAAQDHGWRSLMRSVQRSQRLEKERRGY